MNVSRLLGSERAGRFALLLFALATLTGCTEVLNVAAKEAKSEGGGDAVFLGLRKLNPSAISLPPGYRIEPVVATGEVADFATSRSTRPGPASKVRVQGQERPLDVQFERTGRAMYVVDFGVITTPLIPNPRKDTGVLWRITRVTQ